MNRIMELNQKLSSLKNEARTTKQYKKFLNDIEKEIVSVVFEDEHGRFMNIKDVYAHIENKAINKDIINNHDIAELLGLLKKLRSNIISYKIGNHGESLISTELQKLGSKYKIINNVELNYGNNHVEIDNIVISAKGIFIIEVKNYKFNMYVTENGFLSNSNYNASLADINILDQMNNKKYCLVNLLNEVNENNLQIDFENCVNKVIVSARNTIYDYHKCGVPIKYRNNIVDYIQKFDKADVFTNNQIDMIYNQLASMESDELYLDDFNYEYLKKMLIRVILYIEKDNDIIEINEPVINATKTNNQDSTFENVFDTVVATLGTIAMLYFIYKSSKLKFAFTKA